MEQDMHSFPAIRFQPKNYHKGNTNMFLSARFLFPSWVVVLAVVAGLGVSAAFAQLEPDNVHVQPRSPSNRGMNSVNSSPDTNTGIIRKNVDLVLVPVTVTDVSNRLIKGLDQSSFKLYEGKQQQEIKHFGSEDAPVSIGILLDVSGSMNSKLDRAREAVTELLRSSNPQDEFFLITFANVPTLVHDFTQDPEEIQTRLLFITSKGRTALLDAIYMGVEKMQQARYQRRALIIMSDGGDNRSRYTEHDVKSRVKEADVLVYSIGIFDMTFQSMEEDIGPGLLSDISNVTGATSYTLDSPNDLPLIAERIGAELRNQYLLGFRPGNSKRDGKWRNIKVKLQAPRGMHLHVQARTGYYGPRGD